MKKLLTIFSAFVLGSGSVFGVASCTARTEDKESDTNSDLMILHQMKNEVDSTLTAWLKNKKTININNYSDQITTFNDLISLLTKREDNLILTSKELKTYHFLEQLIIGFRAEFDNLNKSLRDRYLNYYIDMMPLFLVENNILFTLSNINFDKIAEMLKDTPQQILGMIVRINIGYEIRFKQLQVLGSINGVIVITNNVDALSNITDNLEKYFSDFLNIVFEKHNYRFIDTTKINDASNVQELLWDVIRTELKLRDFQFSSKIVPFDTIPTWYKIRNNISKQYASMLLWTNEGYDLDKLTSENFLKFYKRIQFPEGIGVEDNHYVKANITSFVSKDFTIANLPLDKIILEKPVKILVEKTKVDQALLEFAEITMNFWHYYKLETYANKLVFNMNKQDFDVLMEKVKTNLVWDDIKLIFTSIFDFFNKTDKGHLNTYFNVWNPGVYKWSSIKEENLIMVKAERINSTPNFFYNINFGYDNFGYSFFPMDHRPYVEYTFEFKVN